MIDARPFFDAEEFAQAREVRLDLLRFCEQHALTEHFVISQEWRTLQSLQRELLLRFSVQVFGRRASQTIELPKFERPATWWQAFKARHFPSWALRWWPVRNEKMGGGSVTVDAEALFPELAAMPRQEHMMIRYYANEPVYK